MPPAAALSAGLVRIARAAGRGVNAEALAANARSRAMT